MDSWVATHSAVVELRNIVNEHLRNISKRGTSLVAEGRDMTSVVFSDTPYKFYLDASVEVRAKRRFEQQESSYSLEELQELIKERDEIDKNKSVGALKIVPDALYIDCSYLTIEEVYVKVFTCYIRPP